jgi:hypothetical protein
MKFCLSSRQEPSYLQKADEIKVEWRDRNIIYDFSQTYPDKTFVLRWPREESINWAEISRFITVSQGRLLVQAATVQQMEKLKELSCPFYFGYAVGSFYEINTLKSLGVCGLRVAPPAFFEMDKIGLPVRLIPNAPHDGFLPSDPIPGTWIRPEDLHLYEPYNPTVEFEGESLERERALYRIYAEQKVWPGSLNLLFSNFSLGTTNRLIPSTLTEKRLNCGQRCQSGGSCRLCYRAIEMAPPVH